MADLDSVMPVFFDPSEAPGPGEFDGADVIQSTFFGGGAGMVEENPRLVNFAAKAPPMQRPPFLSTVAVPGTSTVGDGKPTAFSDAFVTFGLPEVLHAPFLTMVEANLEDDPSVLAELPFDAFQQAVRGSLLLDDGSPPSLMQQAHCYKLFKALSRLYCHRCWVV